MNDYISREDTIKKIAVAQVKATTGIEDVAYYRAIRIIRDMPAADVQPVKRGRWVTVRVDGDLDIICDQCYERTIMRTDFCPHCGARMIQEGETE